MTDKPEQTAQAPGEDLVKQGQEAAQTIDMTAAAQEAIEFEKDLKAQLRENGKLLGLNFAPNTSIPTMVAELSAAKAQIFQDAPTEEDKAQPVSEQQRRHAVRMENTKLIRIRISCLNPNKAGLPGEIFTVHSRDVGTIKKFVPYNEAGDQYHVPFMLLKFLKRKKFLQIKDPPKGSRGAPTTKMVPEFAIELLEQLTPKELADLAKAQGASEAAED